MRHRVGHRKLGRITPHRMALLRNLATALFERERIRTTLMKAKELRPYAERLITLARREDDRLHARRLAGRELQDRTVMKKLFDDLGARFAARPGGSEYKPEKKGDEKGKKGAAPSSGKGEGEGAEKSPGKAAGKGRAPKSAGGKTSGKKKAEKAEPEA